MYDRLIAKSENKTKTTWNIIKNETGRMHPIEQVPSTLVDMGKLKDKKKTVANAFNNFFLTTSEKLNRYKSEKKKGCYFVFKRFIPRKLSCYFPITEAEIKGIINSLK